VLQVASGVEESDREHVAGAECQDQRDGAPVSGAVDRVRKEGVGRDPAGPD
jgi:hypothetical protein